MNPVKKLARQGDILFIRIDELPSAVKKAPDMIVAHGEVTGHAHRVAMDSGATLLEAIGGDKFVEAEAEWTVTHDEHGPIKFEAGRWEARRQREYTPEAIRRVLD